MAPGPSVPCHVDRWAFVFLPCPGITRLLDYRPAPAYMAESMLAATAQVMNDRLRTEVHVGLRPPAIEDLPLAGCQDVARWGLGTAREPRRDRRTHEYEVCLPSTAEGAELRAAAGSTSGRRIDSHNDLFSRSPRDSKKRSVPGKGSDGGRGPPPPWKADQ